jgi:hypothetical protein
MEQKPNKNVRGPDKFPRKKRGAMAHISMRLPQEVVDFFGKSTVRMREALETYMRENNV